MHTHTQQGWGGSTPIGSVGVRACAMGWIGRRSNRVLLLTGLIALLSLCDLVITLTYLRSVGMPEGNPIARMVMSYNSPTVLIAWKLATIVLTSLVFVVGRRRAVAEVGCWTCLFVLGWLTQRWITYTHEVSHVTPVVHVLAAGGGDSGNWVTMTPQQ